MFNFFKKKVKIAIMSVADIDNYGDTLFPFVAEKEILKRIPNAEFRFFTPTEQIIENRKFYAYTKRTLKWYNPDAILVIGGEVIHKCDELVWHEMYKNIKEPVKSNLPSDTFFDWLDLENIFKAWFSVGVLYLGDDYPKVSHEEIEKLDYIGVRGILSKKFLEDHFWTYNSNIDIVPDIGWIFPRFVPDYIDIVKSVSEKIGLNIEKNNYIIFNTNHSAVEEAEIEDIKDRLAEFSKKTNLTVLILPVISSYEDSDFLTKFKNDYNILLPSNLSLKEKAALLCGAKFYIGSSLHSAITTMAMSKPAALLHNVKLTKFQDLFSHKMEIDYLSEFSGGGHFELYLNKCMEFYADTDIAEGHREASQNYVKFMQSMFDYKMDLLCEKIKLTLK